VQEMTLKNLVFVNKRGKIVNNQSKKRIKIAETVVIKEIKPFLSWLKLKTHLEDFGHQFSFFN